MSTEAIDYSELSKALREGARRYIEERIEPGGFLQAIIANDVDDAEARADYLNFRFIPELIEWFREHAPAECHGSWTAEKEWLAGAPNEKEIAA